MVLLGANSAAVQHPGGDRKTADAYIGDDTGPLLSNRGILGTIVDGWVESSVIYGTILPKYLPDPPQWAKESIDKECLRNTGFMMIFC